MRTLTKITPSDSITAQQIQEEAEKMGIAFPPEFVELMLDYSSAVIEERYYKNEKVKRFFPLTGEFGSVVSEYPELKEILNDLIEDREDAEELVHEHLRAQWLSFAFDPFGNSFCLKLSGEGSGSVFMFNKQRGADETPFSVLANSLHEFIDGLSTGTSITG